MADLHLRAPERRPVPRWLLVAAAQAFALILAGSLIHVPLHSVAPGRTINVLEEIDVRGAPSHASDGQFLLTTASVSTAPLTVWEGIYVWLDPGIGSIPRPFLVPPGTTDEEQDLVNQHDIEESKVVAAVAAFRALGFEVPEVRGVSIVTVIEGTPADGTLRAGDRVIRVGGRRVNGSAAFSRQVRRHDEGKRLRIELERRGERRTIDVRPVEADGRSFVGVTLGPAYRFPSDVVIDSSNVVGPSGGLVFALSIADVFTREDLTRGHIVGVTGIIELDEDGRGIVHPIGAVKEKIRGAARDGAGVFIVPSVEAREAREAAPPGMRVIGVRTLEQALDKLRALPERPRPGA